MKPPDIYPGEVLGGQRFHGARVLRIKLTWLRSEWVETHFLQGIDVFPSAWLGSSIFPFACTRKKSKGESRIRGEHTPTHAGPASAWPLVFWGYGAHTCGPHPPHFLHRKNLGPRIHLAAPSTHESQKSPVRARLMEGGFVYVAPDAPARPSLA